MKHTVVDRFNEKAKTSLSLQGYNFLELFLFKDCPSSGRQICWYSQGAGVFCDKRKTA